MTVNSDKFYDRLADEYETPRQTADERTEKYTEDCEDSWPIHGRRQSNDN